MAQSLFTSPDEFEKFLKLLPHTPILIPIIANNKKPDIPVGESWKDPKHHLTQEQAIIRLCEGKNVGVVANDWLVIVDLDNPDKFKLDIKTLTVETRNGKLHMYYQNAGDVENSVGKNKLAKCGETRAEWQYVLSPGSYVPTDESKNEKGTGLYHIIDPSPLAILHKKDLPEDFIPIGEPTEINPEVLNTPFSPRNKYGWELEDIINRDQKLKELLNNQNAGLPSASEADMSTLTKLLFWEYSEGEAVAILKHYRYRPKLERSNYITNMLGRINRKSKISDTVNPLKWNPKTGYMINFISNNEKQVTIENDRINLDNIIENFKKEFIFKTPTDTEELHYYAEGIYKPAEHLIKTMLENTLGAKATIHYVNEIIEHLKWHSYTEREEFNKNNGYIPFNNGLLNLKTLKLEPFTSDQIFLYKLTDNYDENTDCPKFKQWLKEVQTPDNILILQEYAGYTLLPALPYHKSMWLIGDGRNGKTTFNKTIQNILGKPNIASVQLQTLNGERNFIEYEFYNKLANFADEPTTKKELETPLFKKLTGDDYIAAEVKNKQKRIIFRNYAKFFISGNQYPRVRDNTIAFKQRIIIVKWERQFLEGQGQIQNIESNWLKDPKERSGIINWMIEGLQRLSQNGKFSLTKTQDETMIEFERASDSVSAWLHERVIFNSQKHTERDLVLQDYIEYCEFYGLYQVEDKKLFNRLRNTPRIRDAQARIQGKMTRVWHGIELQPKLEIPEDNTVDNGQLKLSSEADEAHEAGKTQVKIIDNNSKIILTTKIPASCASSASLEPQNNNPKKLIWYVKEILQGEKCDCGALNVTKELLSPNKDSVRKCTQCFEKMRKIFSNAEWRTAYPDLYDCHE